MLAGNRIVIYDEDLHVLRTNLHLTGTTILLLVGVQKRHCHGERRPNTLLALHVDFPVHHLDDVLRNGHAKTGTSVFAGSSGIFLAECIKELRQKLLAHADSRVPDRESKG